MPKPVYIICSKSGAEDKLTGLLSFYHVLEQLNLGMPAPDIQLSPFILRITSVWMRENGDNPEEEYEFRIIMRFPGSGNESLVSNGVFREWH